jgi:hypothetical protein
MKYTNIILATLLIVIAAASRVVFSQAHLYNFAPIGALGLFSGAVVNDKRFAFLLPLLAMFAADLFFQCFTNTPGFYDISQLFTYGGLAIATAIGFRMNNIKILNVLGCALGASTVFFIVSNFGFWLHGWNGYTFSGLSKTYIDAIPFYKNTVIGDLAGSVFLFGIYALLQKSETLAAQEAKA